jgi:hypothetical protein
MAMGALSHDHPETIKIKGEPISETIIKERREG